jgi:DNA-binding NarL/FixJ family response regulator
MINVVLIDDHQIFRDGILSLFTEVKDIKIVGVASGADEGMLKVKISEPDVVLLDISMPDISGIDLIEKLHQLKKDLKILILSMHTREEYIAQAVRAGANGYLAKQDTTKDELTKAIREVMHEKEYFSDSISQIMKAYFLNIARNPDENKKNDVQKLTPREKEVLRLVVEGLSNQEIADKLFVNIRTIETHKTNILQKLKLKNSVDLVKFAIKNKLLEI